jgi:hypothetical protein
MADMMEKGVEAVMATVVVGILLGTVFLIGVDFVATGNTSSLSDNATQIYDVFQILLMLVPFLVLIGGAYSYWK